MWWKKKKLKLLLIMTSCVLLTGAIFPGKLAAETVIEQWVARYNADAYDYVYGIAVDSSGNVYVTGQSYGSGQGYDYATIKYAPDGTQLWVARYNGPGNSDDRAEAIAVDSSGNVYVTGYSTGIDTNKDYATVKYAPDGNELWVARYNGPENGSDSAHAIALDSSDNVYVTGSSYGSSVILYDYATVKYAPDGNELWVARYDGPANSNDHARAIAADNSGNIYVAGESTGTGSYDYYDYATIKYSPPPAPEIVVYPDTLSHDFGDVNIGESMTYVAQIQNTGNANLEVNSVTLDPCGSTDFTITSAPNNPFIVVPGETSVVDIEITYTPTTEGYVSTTLLIESNDADEPLVGVELGGVGVVVEIPPEQQIQDILDFFDQSVSDGTLVGYGPGPCSARRLRALRCMIKSAGVLIKCEYYGWATMILRAVDKKTDGEPRPPDFVAGEAVPTLNQMVKDLIEDLTS
jgi:uncharacterized delta-60 repeat protein